MKNHIDSPGEGHLLTTTAADTSSVRAEVEGVGHTILILHPGMDTGKSYAQTAAILSKRYRVIRLHRRQYRLDLKEDPIHGSPCSISDEVAHVLAITKTIEQPIFLFGHSSGGTVALEALAASPSSFNGAMIYEPALVINGAGGPNLSGDRIERNGEVGDGLKQARQALLAEKPGKALGIFTQIAAKWPGWLANAAGALVARIPAYRTLIPCQIDDLEALERLGIRLDVYAKLNLPVAIVTGEKSPISNKDMATAVANALPMSERITLKGQGHSSHTRDPEQLARVIGAFAARVFE